MKSSYQKTRIRDHTRVGLDHQYSYLLFYFVLSIFHRILCHFPKNDVKMLSWLPKADRKNAGKSRFWRHDVTCQRPVVGLAFSDGEAF
jgi:hypothetical protein